jgi:predicted 3-demethylubiquinone-9 3-methyltransferase (glyoxalase superfamily)
MQITPFLWFNGNAEEATNFYVSVFTNAKLISTMPGPNGTVMGTTFEIQGQRFHTLNGGPQYTFTPAISMFISVETQQEVDDLWGKLTAGGSEDRCGWLKDKYGLSWQVIPTALGRLLGHPDRARAGRVMQAMLQMQKIDIATLQQAADQA